VEVGQRGVLNANVCRWNTTYVSYHNFMRKDSEPLSVRRVHLVRADVTEVTYQLRSAFKPAIGEHARHQGNDGRCNSRHHIPIDSHGDVTLCIVRDFIAYRGGTDNQVVAYSPSTWFQTGVPDANYL